MARDIKNPFNRYRIRVTPHFPRFVKASNWNVTAKWALMEINGRNISFGQIPWSPQYNASSCFSLKLPMFKMKTEASQWNSSMLKSQDHLYSPYRLETRRVKCSHLPRFVTASRIRPKWEFGLGTKAYGIVLLHLHKSLHVITENIPGPYLSAGGERVWAQGFEPRIPEFSAGAYQISQTTACVSLCVKCRSRRTRVSKLFTTLILA